jgi:uncharacterized membrane-anchored protein
MSEVTTARPMASSRFGMAILIVALVQSAVLGWMIYDRISLIGSGREIVLDTVPVDPRSLFRGDYVILNYEVSRFDPSKRGDAGDFARGDTVYVTLTKSGTGRWQASAISHSYPDSVPANEAVMRGRVDFPGRDNMSVKYGIEAYFVPEGEGRALEALVRERNLQVLVAVADDGEAAIKGLMVDGKLQYEEPLF